MAARIRPPVPYGVENVRPAGSRLLAWLKANPFSLERVQRETWDGRVIYRQAMRCERT